MADFYQMQAEVLEHRKHPAPRKPKPIAAGTGYIVFASDRQWPGWNTPKFLDRVYHNLVAAQRAADSLSSRWEHRTIVKVDLPSAGEEKAGA